VTSAAVTCLLFVLFSTLQFVGTVLNSVCHLIDSTQLNSLCSNVAIVPVCGKHSCNLMFYSRLLFYIVVCIRKRPGFKKMSQNKYRDLKSVWSCKSDLVKLLSELFVDLVWLSTDYMRQFDYVNSVEFLYYDF